MLPFQLIELVLTKTGRFDLTFDVSEWAAKKVFSSNQEQECKNGVIETLIKRGKLIELNYLQQKYDFKQGTLISYASCYGHLKIVKFLHEVVGAKYTTYAMDVASLNGHLEVVKYLHSTVGAKCTYYAMDWASKNGHLEIVKYLHSTVGAKCTTAPINWATINGHTEVVQYLRSIGAPKP